MEGFSFYNDGTFYGTTGSNADSDFPDDSLWRLIQRPASLLRSASSHHIPTMKPLLVWLQAPTPSKATSLRTSMVTVLTTLAQIPMIKVSPFPSTGILTTTALTKPW